MVREVMAATFERILAGRWGALGTFSVRLWSSAGLPDDSPVFGARLPGTSRANDGCFRAQGPRPGRSAES